MSSQSSHKVFNEKFIEQPVATASIIAIDFAHGYSTIGFCLNGKSEIIPDTSGRRRTPNYVGFECDGAGVQVGHDAKTNRLIFEEHCIFGLRRLLGKKFSDPSVQECIKNYLPYHVVQGEKDAVCIKISNGKGHSPEDILAKILSYLKQCAEHHLSWEIRYAVITVPVHFNDDQCQAMKDACSIAGLEVLRMIHEPTAAALAYHFQSSISQPKIVMVCDLRKNSFDVAILKLQGSVADVLSAKGASFGAGDFVENLVDHCVDQFMREAGINLKEKTNPHLRTRRVQRALSRLRLACKNGIGELGIASLTVVCLDGLYAVA